MNAVYRLLVDLRDDLEERGQRWALIGGIAVIVYTEARTTRDVDLAVIVESDREAEELVRDMAARGYCRELVLDHERSGRLAMVGLTPPGGTEEGLRADLMFSFAGIEEEVVDSATTLEVLPDLLVPVARVGHLLALKVYGNRLQDQLDGRNLIRVADRVEIKRAREALRRITEFNQVEEDLDRRLSDWISDPDQARGSAKSD